jgi:hypothetical protein
LGCDQQFETGKNRFLINIISRAIIGILVIGPEQIVIDILPRYFGFDILNFHCFRCQHHQRSSCILRQGLVDRECGTLARLDLASFEMVGDQFLR